MSASLSAEARLQILRPGKRVLSIQSHVVSGYAGNKCSIFPLQLHGFEVDFVNSVQFSNHTGYKTIKGQRLSDKELEALYEGLKANEINKYSHILTGYCGETTFLNKIADIVTDCRTVNPTLLFVCDPVMGDNGYYYTPRELMPIYRDRILPLADIITPNAFELGELVGHAVTNETECIAAMDSLFKLHPKLSAIVVTSGIFGASSENMYAYASSRRSAGSAEGTDGIRRSRFTIPLVRGNFVGTGDIFAALLVVWLADLDGDLAGAVRNVIVTLQSILRRTSAAAYGPLAVDEKATAAGKELKLIDSRYDIIAPPTDVIKIQQVDL
uniref:Pyridoxal kinase n=1 Tax=Panagrellus redivivus TaxID=6233 RepID=A0A7E4W4U5_PANRE